MSRAARWTGAVVALAVVLAVAVVLGTWAWARGREKSVPPDPPPAPLAILRATIPDGPNADLLGRGRYLAIAGDCVSCHTARGGRPFAGGLGLKTPFGVIFSVNITSDRETGIGAWSADDFHRALTRGVAPRGVRLYPAFPYPHFSRVTRADSDAIFAWLKTLPPVRYTPPGQPAAVSDERAACHDRLERALLPARALPR